MIKISKIVALVAILALAVAGCTVQPSPINISNNVNVTTTITLGQPAEAAKAGCAAIAKIRVERPETLAVGATGRLSISPLDSAGNERTPECDVADGIDVFANPTNIVAVEDAKSFVTSLKGLAPGDATLTINVGKATATARVTVK